MHGRHVFMSESVDGFYRNDLALSVPLCLCASNEHSIAFAFLAFFAVRDSDALR